LMKCQWAVESKSMKVSRHYDLLGRAAKKVYPVTESEKKCAIEQRMMTKVRMNVEQRIKKHLYVSDGMVINLK
jgi:hypothetical protein